MTVLTVSCISYTNLGSCLAFGGYVTLIAVRGYFGNFWPNMMMFVLKTVKSGESAKNILSW